MCSCRKNRVPQPATPAPAAPTTDTTSSSQQQAG
jgi:hypothetical protein